MIKIVTIEYLLPTLPLLITGILFSFLPAWKRRTLFFSVTVAANFRATPEATRILRTYRIQVWLWTLASIPLALAAAYAQSVWFLCLPMAMQTLGVVLAFALGRNKTKPHAVVQSTQRVATLSAETERLPGGLVTIIGPFIPLMLAALYLDANWDQVPAHFPVHWNLSGIPNRWSDRTVWGVFGSLMLGAAMLAISLLAGYGVLWGAPRRVDDRVRRLSLRLLAATVWIMSVTFSLVAVLPLFHGNIPSGPLLVIIPVAVLFVFTNFIVWRMVRAAPHAEARPEVTPDDCWKLGMFYYNPDDPALMVEKRFGIGYTLNFGNRLSWAFLALLISVPIGVIFAARSL